MQHEITTAGDLLDARGELARRGFARRPVIAYNPARVGLSALPGVNRLRLKEWDYYGLTSPTWFCGMAVSHGGLAGVAFVYFIDFETNELEEGLVVTPLGRGCELPHASTEGDIVFARGGVRLVFERRPGSRVLEIDWPRLKSGRWLRLSATLEQPEHYDSIVMATPIGPRRFYHNEKINCLPATGELVVGDRHLPIRPDQTQGTLDWGRGVWAYRTFWNWASASGFLPDGVTRFGLNLGGGFGDLSAATENCFFLDGVLHKLGWVEITYNPGDYLRPWRFVDDAGRLDLTLTPFFDRHDKTDVLVIRTEAHQMFGRYNGTVVDDAGRAIQVRELLGWAEEHRARW